MTLDLARILSNLKICKKAKKYKKIEYDVTFFFFFGLVFFVLFVFFGITIEIVSN